ncbi:hypothetical protein PVAG01_02078 [Phlyctema vagabunda]|uniref:BTB domain-containing protein n=1 Tax=Phlyctema vagabunda TaxID=108571 RepID=A0ABR4PQ90_9HELO
MASPLKIVTAQVLLARSVTKLAWPGSGDPDTRFIVFDKYEFHVHSIILKLHSAFFRRFLDSPDKIPAPNSAAFRYDWVSKIDGDGSWGLVAAGPNVTNDRRFTTSKQRKEAGGLEILLRVMYGDSIDAIKIPNMERLEAVANLADYYCALRILEPAIPVLVLTSPQILRGFADNTADMLELALKLRNRTFFHDCLIYATNPWHNPRYLESLHGGKRARAYPPQLQTAFKLILARTQSQLADVQEQIINLQRFSWFLDIIKKSTKTCMAKERGRDEPPLPLPLYFRSLLENLQSRLPRRYLDGTYDTKNDDDGVFLCKSALEDLVRNDLLLPKSPYFDEDYYDGSFLAYNLYDKDLPWDRAQLDF